MKKIVYIAAFALIAFSPACAPIDYDEPNIGEIVKDASALKVDIGALYGEDGNLYKVKVNCTSPVTCQWTDGFNTIFSNNGEFVFTFGGTQTLTLKALSADGKILEKDYPITGIKAPPAALAYTWFFGDTEATNASKTWTWQSTTCFGNGGGSDTGPAWWILSPEEMADQCSGKGLPADGKGATMKFVLKGKQMIKTSTDGQVFSGKMEFDMTAGKEGWSIGTVTFINTNILCGYDFNDANYAPWSTYNIIYLDDSKMVLGAQEHAPNSNYWYWVFVAE